jgi:hypothetical protein
VVEARHRDAPPDERRGHPEQGGLLGDLLRGVLAGPGPDDRQQLVLAGHAAGHGQQLLVLAEVGPLDHGQEVEPLLAGDHEEAHVAVGARLDAGDAQPAHGLGVLVRVAGRDRRVVDQAQGLGLEDRHLEGIASAGAALAGQGRQGPGGGEHAGDVLADLAAALVDVDRRSVLGAAGRQRARQRLEQEVAGLLPRPGAARAEGVDADRDRGRVQPPHPLGVEPQHDVGPDDQPIDEIAAVTGEDRALTGPEEAEEGPVGVAVGADRAGRRPAAQGGAAGRFDQHDVGTEVVEELGAVGPGHAGGGVEDPEPVQRCRHAHPPRPSNINWPSACLVRLATPPPRRHHIRSGAWFRLWVGSWG